MNKHILKLATAITALTAATPVHAAISISPAGSQFGSLGGITVERIVSFGVTASLVIAAIVFFFKLVWGGVQWITSGGDKAGNENARKEITNALIGLAIVFSAWAIVLLINTVFSINILSLTIPTI